MELQICYWTNVKPKPRFKAPWKHTSECFFQELTIKPPFLHACNTFLVKDKPYCFLCHYAYFKLLKLQEFNLTWKFKKLEISVEFQTGREVYPPTGLTATLISPWNWLAQLNSLFSYSFSLPPPPLLYL